MTQINSFRDLLVWQKAMDLAVRCYGVSRRMPKDKQPNHLWIAHGSGAELESELMLGARVKVVSEPEAAALISDAQEIGRMRRGLVGSLERSVAKT